MERSSGDARRPAQTLILGVGFGVLGDLLFHHSAVGVNAVLWMGPLAIAGWMAYRRTHRPAGALPGLLVVGVFFAGCLAWRASPFLSFWNVAAVAASAVAIAVQLRGTLWSARIADYLRGAMDAAGDLVAAPVRLLGEVPPSHTGRLARRGLAILTGVVLAVPVVLVFGALLVAADASMDAFVRSLFAWDLEAIATHLVIFGATAWLAAGGLRRIGLAPAAPADVADRPRRSLGTIELGIPLGALTLLLAVFIGLQIRYLFGGEAFVRVAGVTYAEFARRGFFELVVLSALTLPVLLAAQHLVDRGARGSLDSFRALGATIAILVALVMVSALARMRLYVETYGLTEDRFYATAFMLWLGVVLTWWVITEFRGRLERFATGAVVAGFLLLGGLNAANPDAVIARVNVARAAAGAELDAEYLSRLGSDAIPVLSSRWARLDHDARCALRGGMRRAAQRDAGWRAWTWSGWRATRAARAVSAPLGCAAG